MLLWRMLPIGSDHEIWSTLADDPGKAPRPPGSGWNLVAVTSCALGIWYVWSRSSGASDTVPSL